MNTFDKPLLTTTQVMAYFGYKSRTRFGKFMREVNMPHIRINAKKIMFNPDALEQWIKRRAIGHRDWRP